MNLYKICHYFMIDDSDSIYISTNLSKEEVADILVGLQFYVEEHSTYGISCCVSEDSLAHFLCLNYQAKIIKRDDILDTDIEPECWIDMYGERERRCGANSDQYVDLVLEYCDTKFVRNLLLFFSDKRVIHDSQYATLSAKDIEKLN